MKLKPCQEQNRKCLEGKNYEFKTESMYKNIRDFCVGTSEFKKGYQSRTNFISYIWDIPSCVSGRKYIFIQCQSCKTALKFLFYKRLVSALALGYHRALYKDKETENFRTAVSLFHIWCLNQMYIFFLKKPTNALQFMNIILVRSNHRHVSTTRVSVLRVMLVRVYFIIAFVYLF